MHELVVRARQLAYVAGVWILNLLICHKLLRNKTTIITKVILERGSPTTEAEAY